MAPQVSTPYLPHLPLVTGQGGDALKGRPVPHLKSWNGMITDAIHIFDKPTPPPPPPPPSDAAYLDGRVAGAKDVVVVGGHGKHLGRRLNRPQAKVVVREVKHLLDSIG